MSRASSSAGDTIPTECRAPSESASPELRQLFNAIDPSPFRERRRRHNSRSVTQLNTEGTQSHERRTTWRAS